MVTFVEQRMFYILTHIILNFGLVTSLLNCYCLWFVFPMFDFQLHFSLENIVCSPNNLAFIQTTNENKQNN